MAKKNTKVTINQETAGLANVEDKLSKTEQYIESNYKSLLIALCAIIIVAGVIWISHLHKNNRQETAMSQMFQAENYFEADSFRLALDGDGNYLGFIDIVDNFGATASGNLARYYAGVCYLKLGEYDNAVQYLKKYKTKDNVIGSLALGALGDAYIELDDIAMGISKYIDAAELGDNEFTTPLFLLKAGEMYEMNGQYAEALGLYEQIQRDYPNSFEGLSIDRYIAKVKVLMNN